MGFLAGYDVRQMLDLSPSALYSLKGKEPIILAGVHLSALDVEGVVALDDKGRANGIILGYNVLRLIDAKNLWSVFYTTKISDVMLPVRSAKPQDNLEKVVKKIMKSGWGYVVVTGTDGKPTNLVGLLDLASFYIRSKISNKLSDVPIGEKASTPLFSISEKATVAAAIRTMLDKHARRLFVKESKLVLSDRGIIRWLLSPANLAKLRDSPREVLRSSVSSTREILHNPAFVEADDSMATALDLITKNDARCVITRDQKMILTPWDLTIRLLVE